MKLILLFISFYAFWGLSSGLEVMPEFIDQPGMIIHPNDGAVTENDQFIMLK